MRVLIIIILIIEFSLDVRTGQSIIGCYLRGLQGTITTACKATP